MPETGELDPGDFSGFFEHIHGYEPFPWQTRLTKQVLENCAWPKVIDLPTGTGKTAVLDTAVFAMAAQPAISPRRVVFVIDRRIVVDQVYERARQIRDRIEAASTPVLRRVRRRLRKLSDDQPLGVAALRGGIPIDGDWTRRPDQPWVVVSTVDQFGSRLLFRGYGVTPGMRPIHAGLAGNDCLVILDEVHLSVPFAETLAQVSALHSGPLPRRFATVEMSATPSNDQAQRFTLDAKTDLDGCRELVRRVKARKQSKLVTVRNQEAISAAVLKIVKSIDQSIRKNESRIRSIGVVVNRVRTAREVHGALTAAGYPTHLITGRMRPLDRIDALERIGPIVDPDSKERSEQLSVVVATQAIEVGADFSFDAVITECAAVDSLRQRFGRLDRRGTHHECTGSPAKAWIIGPKSVVGTKKPDPIYGESARVTWEELTRRAKDGPLDVGPMSLRDFPDNAVAPRANAPLVLRTHMNAWVQTRPEPIVQPSLDWFLHGMDQNREADVSILWRWDRSSETLRLVPPRQAEFLQIPISAAKSWLANRPEVDIADAGQIRESEGFRLPAERENGDWVRWAGFRKGIDEHVGIKDIHPGDVLIVDPTRGGLNGGTWDPSSEEEVPDLGDEAQIAYGRKATLRLDPRLFASVSLPTPADENEADSPIHSRIANWLEDQQDTHASALKQKATSRLRDNCEVTAVAINSENQEKGYYILTERDDITGKPVVDAETMDGSDETGSFTATGVSLDQHLSGVGERAGKIAERLGLSQGMVADLHLAGRLHDLGKVDPRFQLELVGGDPVELEMRSGEPLAKSLPGARRIQEYPVGMRHEIASVAMIESNGDILGPAHDKDLVLHLVGTHHGWGRPLPPIIEDPEQQVMSYTLDGHHLEASSELAETSLALDMADRFWRLVERYGYHGLAWLEAILRLADHQQSAEEGRI
ncbi:MAG: type I-U CRISPR-associated helicase/endonuclease Cas3 [Chloroflexi bacterium]|nr:type I-U CRISPR-associated helicase/endonuclease Cas3 [Chloroflexota bacterium]